MQASKVRSKLLITGASGFLGSMVVLEAARSERWDIIAVSLSHKVHAAGVTSVICDLSNAEIARHVISRSNPNAVVNCAALANVDACEAERELATQLNTEAPAVIADACATVGARFVHVSTDAVFGATPPPYRPESETSPLNWYGESKLAGEVAALDANRNAAIVRTNIVGWSPLGNRSLLEFFANRFEAGNPTPGFDDVMFRPATTPQVARALLDLAVTSDSGIIHATGNQLISKYEFGRLVALSLGFDADLVERTSISTSGLTAQRANCLDVVPSIEIPAVRDNINLERGMTEIADLRSEGIRRTLLALGGVAA